MISTFTVPLFIVIDENFRFASILQLAPTPTFHIGPFKFTLVASFAFEGFRYIVALGDMSLSVLLLPVDTSAREVGLLSNLDFLNFLWQYYEHFNFRKFGIIAFPFRDRARFLYVQHHARSDGCRLLNCATSARGLSTKICTTCTRAHWHPRADMSSVCDNHRRRRRVRHMSCLPSCSFSRGFGYHRWRLTTTLSRLQLGAFGFCPTITTCRCLPYAGTPCQPHGWTVSLALCTPKATLRPFSFTYFGTAGEAINSIEWDRQRWWCSACDYPLFVCASCALTDTH
jgi:hypothetical protein